MSQARRVALFAGSFDPFTRGHEDLVRRAFAFADEVIVGVAANSAKNAMFSTEERLALVRAAMADEPRVRAVELDGRLLVDFAREQGATMLVRGLRGVTDFDYEYQMAMMNRHLAPGIEIVFLLPSHATSFISATLVREVARLGGDVRELVHPVVAEALARKRAS
jgi:pantetheine-phosphate adenylyltransferase